MRKTWIYHFSAIQRLNDRKNCSLSISLETSEGVFFHQLQVKWKSRFGFFVHYQLITSKTLYSTVCSSGETNPTQPWKWKDFQNSVWLCSWIPNGCSDTGIRNDWINYWLPEQRKIYDTFACCIWIIKESKTNISFPSYIINIHICEIIKN